MDYIMVTYDCTCCRCGTKFTIDSTSGESLICDKCALALLKIIYPL